MPPEQNDPDYLLTVYEAAQILGVGEETIRRWLRSGELRGIRLSRKAGWRIRHADIYDYLDSRVVGNFSVPRPWQSTDGTGSK